MRVCICVFGGVARGDDEREKERESPTVPAMSLETCVLLLNHFPLKKIKKAEIFSLPLNGFICICKFC